MGSEPMRTVRGEVVIPADVPTSGTADLVVQVEDVSRADAPSIVIAEERRPGVPLQAGATVPFEIEVPAGSIDDKGMYSVRAHLDVSGSGTVEVGDLVSTQSHPVLTHGYGDEAKVGVKRV
jgi:putative lipoprotein